MFFSIPLKETIDYILDEICVNRKMKPICSKLIFKRFLYKLTTECTLQFNTKFFKRIDGCSMGGSLAVSLSDIYEHDIIFENLKKYHPKINSTIEVNPCKFLDTKIINNKGNITAEVFCMTSKLLVHWSFRVPKRYR